MLNCITIFLVIFISSFVSHCQPGIDRQYKPSSLESLDSLVNVLIPKDYYTDRKKELLVVFTLRVDSLGEIHSAHMRRSSNLNQKYYYDVCRRLEDEVYVKFLYDKFYDRSIHTKYVRVDYLFSSKKRE